MIIFLNRSHSSFQLRQTAHDHFLSLTVLTFNPIGLGLIPLLMPSRVIYSGITPNPSLFSNSFMVLLSPSFASLLFSASLNPCIMFLAQTSRSLSCKRSSFFVSSIICLKSVGIIFGCFSLALSAYE